MKKFIKLFSLILCVSFLFNSCRNPAYELNVLFDADVIQYKATLILKDATGKTLPNNIAVSISGTDAAAIYDFSGTKAIFAPAGVITLGVAPKLVPVSGKTLSFNVGITAPGYESKNIPVTIAFNQFSQVINVTMLQTVVNTPASSVATKDITLGVDGKSTVVTSFSTPNTGTVAQSTTITVPAGVQFKSADGTILTGGSVSAQAINFSSASPAALALFPGGKLSGDNVVGADGKTGTSFFLPAGFTDIQMFVGGVEVKNFSTPIAIGIQLDPTFKPQGTGAALKAGDVLSIYSYQTATGQFKFETTGIVGYDAANKLSVTFSTNHLTVFIVGDVVNTTTCKAPKVTYVAPWLNGSSAPLTVQILSADGAKVLASNTVLVTDGKVDSFVGLPPVAVKYQVLDASNTVLATGTIADPCAGADIVITVGTPANPVQNVTLQLNVVCPGKGSIVVPNFDLFYKVAGAPNSTYALLGTAVKGQIKTALLKVGSSYDFRATWKNEIKVVNNRLISSIDLSTTVDQNGYLGDKSPNGNKALLIEACKTQ